MRLPDRHKQISGEEKILKLLGQNQRLYPRSWEVESWASLWPKDNTTTCTGSRARSTGLPPPPQGALSLLAVFPLPYWLLASCPLQPPVPFTLPPVTSQSSSAQMVCSDASYKHISLSQNMDNNHVQLFAQ